MTERLQKYTDFKEQLIRILRLKTAYAIPLILSTLGVIPKKVHGSLEVPVPALLCIF
jgi:hypothetical protein